MTTAQNIYLTILNGKSYSNDLLVKIVNYQSYGQSASALQEDLIILNAQIAALERYYNNNFETNGEVIAEPEYECLTQAELDALVAKIVKAVGCNKYTYSSWILGSGIWDDSLLWDDTQLWID